MSGLPIELRQYGEIIASLAFLQYQVFASYNREESLSLGSATANGKPKEPTVSAEEGESRRPQDPHVPHNQVEVEGEEDQDR